MENNVIFESTLMLRNFEFVSFTKLSILKTKVPCEVFVCPQAALEGIREPTFRASPALALHSGQIAP